MSCNDLRLLFHVRERKQIGLDKTRRGWQTEMGNPIAKNAESTGPREHVAGVGLRARRAGFTIVELLVVVTVIVLLITLLQPAMSRAMFVANTTVCQSNFRQGSFAVISYAGDNLGNFPRHDMPWMITGQNPWDIVTTSTRAFDTYGYSWKLWYCPAQYSTPPDKVYQTFDQWIAAGEAVWSNNGWWIPPYSYWVPRVMGNTHPVPSSDNGPTGANMTAVFATWPNSPRHCNNSSRPVFTDWASSSLSSPNPTDPYQASNGHMFKGAFENMTDAFGDGHTELHKHSTMHYVGSPANWNAWW